MKRIVCLFAAVCVCFSSAFAWNAESFLSDGSAEYQPYSLDPVEDPVPDPAQVPMMMSLDPSSFSLQTGSVSSVSLFDLILDRGVCEPSSAFLNAYYLNTISYPIQQEISYPVQFNAGSLSPVLKYGSAWLLSSSYAVPSEYSDDPFDNSVEFPWFVSYPSSGPNYLTFTFNVSDYQSSAVQFYGTPILVYTLTEPGEPMDRAFISSGAISINGNQVHRFNGEFGGYIFESDSIIETISISFDNDALFGYSAGTYSFNIYYDQVSTASLSFLTGSPILDGFNDEAQNDINEHNAIESEWTGSMTENFNALDLSGFTFPGGLVAAFALITGIFNDLWNGMGDYKILYVFPLTLGVVLLLIGRISKFSDRSSSANSSSGRSSSGRGGKGGRSA